MSAAEAESTFYEALTRGAGRGGSYRVFSRWDAPEVERTFADVMDEVEERAAGLAAKGIEPGQTVGILSGMSFDYIVGLLSIWRAGATVAALHPPAAGADRSVWATQSARVLELTRASCLLVGPGMPQFDSPVPSFKVAELKASTSLGRVADPTGWAPLILFTSGTTGEPKGMVLGRKAVISRTESEDRLELVSDRHRWLSFSPTHFVPGVAAVIRPLAQGVPMTLVPTHVVMGDPGRWIVELGRERTTHTGGFSEAFKLAARAIAKGLDEPVDLSSIEVVTCTGEVIDHVSLMAFARAAEPLGFDPSTFTLKYAMTEGGLIASSKTGAGLKIDRVTRASLENGIAEPAAEDDDNVAEFPSAGEVMPYATVRIVSEEGTELGERRVGEIHVSSPYLMEGYLGDIGSAPTAIVDGWLRTGDLGYLADGELYIAGRAKLMIIVRSKNYFAEDLEQIVEGIHEISRGRTVAFGARKGPTEEVVIVTEPANVEADLSGVPRAVSKALWRQLGLTPLDVLVLAPGTLPSTTTGKLARATVKKVYESGGFETAVLARKGEVGR